MPDQSIFALDSITPRRLVSHSLGAAGTVKVKKMSSNEDTLGNGLFLSPDGGVFYLSMYNVNGNGYRLRFSWGGALAIEQRNRDTGEWPVIRTF